MNPSTLSHLHLQPSFLRRPPHLSPPTTRLRSSMAPPPPPPPPLMSFPHLPPPHRDLMVHLLTTIHSRLGPSLLPSTVPADVLSLQNAAGTSHGSLDIHSGAPGSAVDSIIESCFHCKFPTGALNLTTILGFLNSSTDAPHLLLEYLQSRPTSLVLFMDLIPRHDLVTHPDYLDEFYQDTGLDKQRQILEKVPQVSRYISSSLYIRSLLSPTAIAVNINFEAEGQSALNDMMDAEIGNASKEIVGIWLDKCASCTRQLGDTEKAQLIKRDNLIKTKAIEMDLTANLPKLFGADVAARVVREIQKTYRV